MAEYFVEARSELHLLRKTMGCCVRCAMRYACVRDAAAYQLSEEELEAAMAIPPEADAAAGTDADEAADDTADTPASASTVCPLCLGILQHCVRPAAVTQVADVVRSSGFELRDFALVVSVPVQLLLRERGAWLHLQRARAASAATSGGGFTSIAPSRNGRPAGGVAGEPRYDKIVDVKEALRWSMAPALAKALGVLCEGSSTCLVHISLSHTACAGEHHDIIGKLQPVDNSYQKRKRQNHQSQPDNSYDSIRTVTRALSMERADNLISASRLCPPPPPPVACVVGVNVERANITLTGRYKKYSRQLVRHRVSNSRSARAWVYGRLHFLISISS